MKRNKKTKIPNVLKKSVFVACTKTSLIYIILRSFFGLLFVAVVIRYIGIYEYIVLCMPMVLYCDAFIYIYIYLSYYNHIAICTKSRCTRRIAVHRRYSKTFRKIFSFWFCLYFASFIHFVRFVNGLVLCGCRYVYVYMRSIIFIMFLFCFSRFSLYSRFCFYLWYSLATKMMMIISFSNCIRFFWSIFKHFSVSHIFAVYL